MYRSEYPRPNFIRDRYLVLNGEWEFDFDKDDVSLSEKWHSKDKHLSRKIQVPFVFEAQLSEINIQSFNDRVFYKRKIVVPTEWKGDRIVLHFGAVDYYCKVFINGYMVGDHAGGHTNFSFDITDYLNFQDDDISVYVFDPHDDETIPRGKQYWREKSERIWYTRTTGIWQSVWIEPTSKTSIRDTRFTPDVDNGTVMFEVEFSEKVEDGTLIFEMSYKGEKLAYDTFEVKENFIKRSIDVFGRKILNTFHYNIIGMCWTPETPNLIDVKLTLIKDNKKLDEIVTYFGMRKIHTKDGMIFLNNRPYYLKLVLDQGYWPQGVMTAPDDNAFVKDIELSKLMGFNGCRKHQKVEDPRFLYWADKLGYIVWGEVASSRIYTPDSAVRLLKEWTEIIKRDYNHPSIVAWVPLNESWGVLSISTNKEQAHHSLSLYHTIKSMDTTRLVVNNDGWEMTKTDICAVHNYAHGEDNQTEKYEFFKKVLSSRELMVKNYSADRPIYAEGFKYGGEPILVTECGGISYDVDVQAGWGYTTAKNEEQYIGQYKRIINALYDSEVIFGFCYTQLTDVEQEVNGLLTYDRKPKCPLAKIKEINDKWHPKMSF